jgi:hypothetical protein
VPGLEQARQLAARLRFGGEDDTGAPGNGAGASPTGDAVSGDSPGSAAPGLLRSLYEHSLEVSALLTPQIEDSVATACTRLQLPRSAVRVFLRHSTEHQAGCVPVGPDHCLVMVSSGLANALAPAGLSFVVGHEIGHFLLGHRPLAVEEGALETFRYSKAQELSVDRLGLLAAGSLQAAATALTQTLSGLDARLLRMDVGQVLAQYDELTRLEGGTSSFSTHPSLVFRVRALVWFATLLDDRWSGPRTPARARRTDERIARELEGQENPGLRRHLDSLAHDLALWITLSQLLADGRFDRREQAFCRRRFGPALTEKIKTHLASMSPPEVATFLEERLHATETELTALSPQRATQTRSAIEQELRAFHDPPAAQARGRTPENEGRRPGTGGQEPVDEGR